MLGPITKGIDWLIGKQGQLSSFLIYPLLLIVIYEVIMRYVFNAPTIWGFEATAFAYGLHFMLGLSYTENQSGHVKVDILTSRLSKKAQAILGVVTYILIFMPVYALMTIGAFKFAYTSTVTNELNSTSWAPPIWPFKIVMAISFLFLVLQGLSTLLKNIRTLSEKNPAQIEER
jgi:TRAP-type mannitol/chloroaromatic compound transport system permease small subunit